MKSKKDKIIIKGAGEHNLKNIDVVIPRNQLVVITGISGSGKTTLAFDTIYAEGQRRYVESLSAYARQFLGQMEKPKVDYIEGLSPAISIDQKTTHRNPRSTVGTVTEIYDYLRLLYARVGKPHCPQCGEPITSQSLDEMVDRVLDMPEKTRIQILAPLVRGRKGEHQQILDQARRDGFVRVRVDGEVLSLDEEIKLEKNIKHNIEVVVDRIIIKEGIRERLADSLETSLHIGQGIVVIERDGEEDIILSEKFACIQCGIDIEELTPRLFSFNSPFGACNYCDGLGEMHEFSSDLVLDRDLSLAQGAIRPWRNSSSRYIEQLQEAAATALGISMKTPLVDVPEEKIEKILYGLDEKISFRYTNRWGRTRQHNTYFRGIINYLRRRLEETGSDGVKDSLDQFMERNPCPRCKGNRLRPEALAVTVGGISIMDITRMAVDKSFDFFASLKLGSRDEMIAREIIKEIKTRLSFLINVGLEYLSLSRKAGTLSGGEAQRIRLATQIGSQLVGVLYILDEPSIGLHQRDNNRLINMLQELRDLGNTVIIVEHDEETIRSADHVIDIGPGAGRHGGEVVAQGTPDQISQNKKSLTGDYLARRKKIAVPTERYLPNGKFVEIKGARQHNLKNIDVAIPLGTFTCVTGVSGSGKSTLVNEILHRALMRHFYNSLDRPGDHDKIEGLENLDKVVTIDQSPIGRTPRSNPATYTKVFDHIRELFSQTAEARRRGYNKGRFSFNVKGGRCEACRGDGIIKIEMHFLPDVYVPCEVCGGARYNRETLEIKYKGKTIAQVLDMIVEEALEFFGNIPPIKRRLQTMNDVGLGYIRLGQPATTLSGGEAQRVKISSELCKKSTGKTLYILDEPTTGLHFADIKNLLSVLSRLRQGGNTVIVIEHNLDVVKSADYLIDLGPEGGEKGGYVIATGTPEAVSRVKESYTGQFLSPLLNVEQSGVEAGN